MVGGRSRRSCPALLALALGAGLVWLALGTSFLAPAAGPVGRYIAEPAIGSFTQGYSGYVGRPITFLSYALPNPTGAPERILEVLSTNRPPHIILRAGIVIAPPGGGAALGWVPRHWHALPAFVPPLASPRAFVPTLGMEATRPGVYVVQGLLLVYESLGHRYVAYLPGQFVLCAGLGRRGECPADLPPPPLQWPALQLPGGL